MSNNEDNTCTVCYNENKNQTPFYKCLKYHNLCGDCFNDYDNCTKWMSTCPTCRASLEPEFKNPSNLLFTEITNIKQNIIRPQDIYIHRNFKFKEQTSVCIVKTKESTIRLFLDNGKIMMFKGLFVAQDGFLYKYSNRYKTYYLAVTNNKYQLWNIYKMPSI